MSHRPPYDAVLLVSFGGPEGPEQVMPFLQNVTRGRNVPEERLREVAEHYYRFGGVSPINQQCRRLLAALRERMSARGLELPLYWGNRNWHPLLPDTVAQMTADGVRRALAFVTSAYSSYSSCRQYLDDLEQAHRAVGEQAPRIDKIRPFYNHPRFVEVMALRTREALARLPRPPEEAATRVVFTAHSLPLSMARQCPYAEQLHQVCTWVAQAVPVEHWDLVYQSRSGPPQVPWLEPDVLDHLRRLPESGVQQVVLVPVGFVSDHMEVIYDLDVEAAELCQQLGLAVARAATPGVHPVFVEMIVDLIEERVRGTPALAMAGSEPWPPQCPPDCCPRPQRSVPQRPMSQRPGSQQEPPAGASGEQTPAE